MAIADDFSIDYNNQIVYYETPGSGDIYTVRQLYSYLQDTFDELDQLDDTIPMSAQTPTNYTLINGWFMDDRSYRVLKGGAIITNGYEDEIYIKPYDASVAFSASDIGETITETDTGQTGKILAYDERTDVGNHIGYVWIRPDGAYTFVDVNSAYTVSNSSAAGVFTAISTTGEDLLPNLYTLGSIDETDNQQIYIVQNGVRIASGTEWWPEAGSQHIDVLIKVVELGTAIDSGKLTIFLRHYPDSADKADLYDHFPVTISPTGTGDRNAIPLATSLDLNNPTASSTVGVSPYTNIDIVFVNGTVTHGAITDGPFEDYETVTWTGGSGIFLRENSGTMTIGNVTGDSGPLNSEVITGSTSAAYTTTSADMTKAHTVQKQFEQASLKNYDVCINCATLELTKVYEYLKYVTRIDSSFTTYGMKMTGAALAFNVLDGEQYITAYNDLDTPANTYANVKASPFGTFAGGKFFGARGIWIENMADADIQNFQLIDSDNTGQNPPNKQAIVISNLLSGDRVAVFRTSSGTTINKEMYSSGTGNVTNNTTFVVTGAISVDTPSSGYIRIVDTLDTSSTRETRYSYSSWATSTFSGIDKIPGGGGLDREYTQTVDKAYIPFIDQAVTGTGTVSVSVTVIYTVDRTILLRVRRKTATAILPFETTGTYGSTGFSTSAIRTTDTIVQ